MKPTRAKGNHLNERETALPLDADFCAFKFRIVCKFFKNQIYWGKQPAPSPSRLAIDTDQ